MNTLKSAVNSLLLAAYHYIPSTLRVTVAESLPTTLLAVQVSSWESDSTVSLIVRVPPSTRIRVSPNVATSTPSSLVHVTRGAGFPDEVQVNVAVEPICSSSSGGETSTVGWAGERERGGITFIEGRKERRKDGENSAGTEWRESILWITNYGIVAINMGSDMGRCGPSDQ